MRVLVVRPQKSMRVPVSFLKRAVRRILTVG